MNGIRGNFFPGTAQSEVEKTIPCFDTPQGDLVQESGQGRALETDLARLGIAIDAKRGLHQAQ